MNDFDSNNLPKRGLKSTLYKSDYENKKKLKHGLIFWFIGLAILVILIGAIVVGYNHYHKKSVVATNVVTTAPLTSRIGLPVANQQYYSTNLSLGFNYPKGWVIDDKNNTNILTIQSPAVELLTSTSKLVKGQITLTIQNQSPVVQVFKKAMLQQRLGRRLLLIPTQRQIKERQHISVSYTMPARLHPVVISTQYI
ncbi:MAG: hypothetical protein ABSB12_01385 [Candidatus Saccharimonadales bacterium]